MLLSEYKSVVCVKPFRRVTLALQKADGLSEKQSGYFSFYFMRIRRSERQNLTGKTN